ncbi:hypothetical protein HDU76_013596, partial [Blyttiomyces sp. JEL0837]
IYTYKLRDTGFEPMDYVDLMKKYKYKTFVTTKMAPYVFGQESDGGVDVIFVHQDVFDGAGVGEDLKAILRI